MEINITIAKRKRAIDDNNNESLDAQRNKTKRTRQFFSTVVKYMAVALL